MILTVDADKRFWVQAALLVILGLSWLVRGIFEKSVVRMVVGVSLMFALISLVSTAYVRSDSKIKRAVEIVSGAAALGAIICGYIVSGDLRLMILTVLISALFILAFILSYILPRISPKTS